MPRPRCAPRSTGSATSTCWSTTPGPWGGLLRGADARAGRTAAGDEPPRPDECHPRDPAHHAHAALGSHHLDLVGGGPHRLRVLFRLCRVEVRSRGLDGVAATRGRAVRHPHHHIVNPGFFRTKLLTKESMTFADRSIEDYADRRAEQLKWWEPQNGRQPGDPAKLARALVRVAGEQSPPRRFITGADAIALAEQKVADLKAQIDAYHQLSTSLSLD